MKYIWCKLHVVQGKITHIFRKGNTVENALADEVIGLQQIKEFYYFMDLLANVRKCINMDKSQIPILKIRTHKIEM